MVSVRRLFRREPTVNLMRDVLQVVDSVLGLRGRSNSFDSNTPLLGAVPELDSMAVVSLITALEQRFDLLIDDDDISGAAFATAGSLTDFVSRKLAA
jgi:acyl carrier protein